MTEEEWLACDDPRSMTEFIWLLATDRQLRFVVSGFFRRKHIGLRIKSWRSWRLPSNSPTTRFSPILWRWRPRRNDMTPIGRMNPVDEPRVGWAATPGVDIEREWYVDHKGRNTIFTRLSLLRDIFGNPFRPVTFSPEWCTSTAVPWRRRCTSRGTSPRCRFSRTRSKTLGATMPTSWPTAATRSKFTFAVAG